MYDLASVLYPICRSITGDGVRETLRVIGEALPAHGARGADRHGGVRLDGPARVEHPRGVHQGPARRAGRRLRSVTTCTSWATACRCAHACRSTELRPHLHTLPEHPSGSRTARRTTTRPGASASRTTQLAALADGDYEVVHRQHPRRRPPHLRRVLPARLDDRRGADLGARLPPVAGQRQPLGHRARDACSRGRSRHAPRGYSTGSSSRPARSARSRGCARTASRRRADQARPGPDLRRRPRAADVQAQPARRRGDRPRRRPRPRALGRARTSSSTSRPTATTSASTARPAFDLPVGCFMRTP